MGGWGYVEVRVGVCVNGARSKLLWGLGVGRSEVNVIHVD